MRDTLESRYMSWLVSQLDPEKGYIFENYYTLFILLHQTEFVWFVPNDENRFADGIELRNEYLSMSNEGVSPEEADWLEVGCTMLELLVVLVRAMNFQTDRPYDEITMELLKNAQLADFKNKSPRPITRERVKEVTDRIIWRYYEPDGWGGFFPLDDAQKDQRKVELWYQMMAYILESDAFADALT